MAIRKLFQSLHPSALGGLPISNPVTVCRPSRPARDASCEKYRKLTYFTKSLPLSWPPGTGQGYECVQGAHKNCRAYHFRCCNPAETLTVRGHLGQQALQQRVAQATAGEPGINESAVLNLFGNRLFRSSLWPILLSTAIWTLLEFSLTTERRKNSLIATVSRTKEGTISALVRPSLRR